MNRLIRSLALVGASCIGTLAMAAPMLAQAGSRVVPSFWVMAGPGIGRGQLGCDDCDASPSAATGPIVSFGAGATMTSWLDVGATVNGWWGTVGQERWRIAMVLATARVFPIKGAGLYVAGGAGYSHFVAKLDPATSDRAVANGLGWEVGGGYLIDIGRHLSLEPFVKYAAGASAELGFGTGSSGYSVRPKLMAGGVAIRWRWWPVEER